MKKWFALSCAALMVFGARTLRAQDASSAASGASSAASGASGASASPSTFAGLIAAGFKELKKLKAKCCNDCPSGQIIKAMTKQLNMATGGLICPGCCPEVSDADKKKSSTSAEGACAKITQDTIDSKKRIAAVQCLAYVDCHWWPEAEAALINSLRTDKNECVRLAAAQVLQKGCCCTKKVIAALKIVVEGSNKDGNPSENSERVRNAAMGALQHCLCSYQEEAPSERPEAPPKAAPAAGGASAKKISDTLPWYVYYEQVDNEPMADLVVDARRVVAVGQRVAATQEPVYVPTGRRNLFDLWAKASDGSAQQAGTMPAGVQRQAPTAPSAPVRTPRQALTPVRQQRPPVVHTPQAPPLPRKPIVRGVEAATEPTPPRATLGMPLVPLDNAGTRQTQSVRTGAHATIMFQEIQ